MTTSRFTLLALTSAAALLAGCGSNRADQAAKTEATGTATSEVVGE